MNEFREGFVIICTDASASIAGKGDGKAQVLSLTQKGLDFRVEPLHANIEAEGLMLYIYYQNGIQRNHALAIVQEYVNKGAVE